MAEGIAKVPVWVTTERFVDVKVLEDDGFTHWVHESSKVIDHDDSSDRKWLGSHCFWAMRNGRRVTTEPAN